MKIVEIIRLIHESVRNSDVLVRRRSLPDLPTTQKRNVQDSILSPLSPILPMVTMIILAMIMAIIIVNSPPHIHVHRDYAHHSCNTSCDDEKTCWCSVRPPKPVNCAQT